MPFPTGIAGNGTRSDYEISDKGLLLSFWLFWTSFSALSTSLKESASLLSGTCTEPHGLHWASFSPGWTLPAPSADCCSQRSEPLTLSVLPNYRETPEQSVSQISRASTFCCSTSKLLLLMFTLWEEVGSCDAVSFLILPLKEVFNLALMDCLFFFW